MEKRNRTGGRLAVLWIAPLSACLWGFPWALEELTRAPAVVEGSGEKLQSPRWQRRGAARPGAARKRDSGQSGELERRTLNHGGLAREYYVHYPKGMRPAHAKPVVLVLHGGGGADAPTMASRTGMNGIADREDFIAVYPMGVDGQWNDGRGKSFRRDFDNSSVDDVGFLGAVADEFIREGLGDASRVYAMGLSNGGMMTHRLGIELGHKFAAIAAIIANLPVNLAALRPARSPSVLIMNGTADPMMPWSGGPVRVLGSEYGEVLSTDETVLFWVKAAGLGGSRSTQKLKDEVIEDRSTVEVDTYSRPGHPLEVVLYRIRNGGHQLPGAGTPDRPLLLGPKNLDINGPEEVWRFFSRHALARQSASGQQPARAAAGRSGRDGGGDKAELESRAGMKSASQ